MKKKDLIKLIKQTPGDEVFVKVEGGLFLPITSVATFDGSVVIVCKDITRKDEAIWQTSIFQK